MIGDEASDITGCSTDRVAEVGYAVSGAKDTAAESGWVCAIEGVVVDVCEWALRQGCNGVPAGELARDGVVVSVAEVEEAGFGVLELAVELQLCGGAAGFPAGGDVAVG